MIIEKIFTLVLLYSFQLSTAFVPYSTDHSSANNLEVGESPVSTSDEAKPAGLKVFKAKLWLEGFYDTTIQAMSRELNSQSLLPLAQPYVIAPYEYFGSETVGTMPAEAVDWLLIELRDGQNPTSVVARKAVLVYENGNIYDVDGTEGAVFSDLQEEPYFVVIYHKSHLAVMTAQSVILDLDPPVYDFTTGANQVMGVEQVKDLSGAFGLYAGDYDGNGIINNVDFNAWKQDGATIGAYLRVDGDGNGIVNNLDYNLWTGNKSKIGDTNIQF